MAGRYSNWGKAPKFGSEKKSLYFVKNLLCSFSNHIFYFVRRYAMTTEKTEIIASYDQDSKRYHRYVIDEGQGIVGNIYIPKDKDIPKELKITLRVKE